MAAKTLYLILIVVIIVCLMESAVAAPQQAVTAAPTVPTPETPPGILESFRGLLGSIFTKFSTVL